MAKDDSKGDVEMLRAAADDYAASVVEWSKAWDEHQKDGHLDEYHKKRCKSETRLYYAQIAKDQLGEKLRATALVFSGGDAAEIGRDILDAIERRKS